MLKLFIRFYLSMLIVTAIVLVIGLQMFLFVPGVQDMLANANVQSVLTPIFSYIDQNLVAAPENTWPKIVNNLAPTEPHTPIEIMPLNQIKLSSTQTQNLLKGDIIGVPKFFHAPLHDTTDTYAATAYQRIGQSNFALVMNIKEGQDDNFELPQQMWLIHFINLELSKTPANQANAALQKFSQTYDIKLAFVPLEQFTPEIQTYLKRHGYLHDQGNNLNVLINFYYLYTPDTVLVMGPYEYPWYLSQFLSIFLCVVMLIVALFMLVSLYTFYRDLKKLDRLATAYGEGDFNYPVKVRRYAALGSLYSNLKNMGQRIQALLTSHKNLTQAVSHELKTPLARLKFAITMAGEAENKEKQQDYLMQASDSVNDLERLVSELLMYTRFDRQFFNQDQHHLKIHQVLPALLAELEQRYPQKKLKLNLSINEATEINLSVEYFKKLLDNLLSNAMRYAKTQVEVKVYQDKNQVYLEVNDDGPGIPEAYYQKIFEPFFSIDESRNKELSGHGLGLAIVERIVKAHHGNISVKHSETLSGASFILSFPINGSAFVIPA